MRKSEKSNRQHHEDLVEGLVEHVSNYLDTVRKDDPVSIAAIHDFSPASDSGFLVVLVGAEFRTARKMISALVEARQ